MVADTGWVRTKSLEHRSHQAIAQNPNVANDSQPGPGPQYQL